MAILYSCANISAILVRGLFQRAASAPACSLWDFNLPELGLVGLIVDNLQPLMAEEFPR